MIKNERGFTLIEVLIAVALVAIISVAFLSGLATASKALVITDEHATAESLARSQMEYVKKQPYAASYTPATIPPEPEYNGYSVVIDVSGVPGALGGIQKITVTVSHHGKEIIALEGYKVN